MPRRRRDLHVLGDVDQDRAGTAGRRDLESLVHDRGKLGRVADQIVVLGAVPGNTDRIRFLERIGPDQARRDLAGDDDHRNRIHEGVGDAGDRVRRTGPRGDQHDARLAGGTGIAFGGMGRAGLLPHEDMANTLVMEQGVVNRQHRTAGIAEHEFDPEPRQAVDQNLRAAALFTHCLVLFFELRASKRTDPAQQWRCRVTSPNSHEPAVQALCGAI